MVALTPLLRTPPRFSQLEPELPPCDPCARVCESWRDSALYPFCLVDGELFVHPCADLDEWYASACDDAATPDCSFVHAIEGVDAVEERVAVGSGDDVPVRVHGSAPHPGALRSWQDDVTCCSARADDREDTGDAASCSGLTWSSESVSSGSILTDDELEIIFVDFQTYGPFTDSQMDQTLLEPPAITWQRAKSPSSTPDPELAEYGDLIQSILAAGFASDPLL